MKLKIILMFFCVLILSAGCKSTIDVERVNVTPTPIIDSVFTNRAIAFFVTEKNIVLQDYIDDEGFIKIYGLDGALEAKIGKIGQGPKEFVTPNSIRYGANSILTKDLNSNRIALTNLENIRENDLSQEFVTFFDFEKEISDLTSDLSGNIITYNPEKDSIITIYNPTGEVIISFGKLPFKFLSSVKDKRSAFSGKIHYNSFNKKLLLCLNKIPYSAVYEVDGVNAKLLAEKTLAAFDYEIRDNKLILDSPGKDCMVESTLMKDYIVNGENDPDYVGSDHSRTSPKRYTVGIYDYNLDLKKIVNLNMVRYYLTSFGMNNTFYALAQNPDFCIVKVDL